MTYFEDNISLKRANTDTSSFDGGFVDDNSSIAYSNLFYPYILDNAGSLSNVSLVIDILNSKDIESDTNGIINSSLVSQDRICGDISKVRDVWGFIETNHTKKMSTAISNSICFSGQKITFYIAPKGHGVGYLNDKIVFCKTTMMVTATNIVNGLSETLYTFDNFEDIETSTNRYFEWTVPNVDSSFYSSYGLFGLVVLAINVTKSYYYNPENTEPIEENCPNTTQNLTQLLIYSPSREIIDVQIPYFDIKTSLPALGDTYNQIFAKTVFSALENDNLNGLTDDQRRAIIADQIAVLFISQHPVLSADFYPSKIIGVGCEESIQARKIINNITQYSLKYPETVQLVKDRLFALLANYKAFNYSQDFEEYVTNFNQSSQTIRDPVRIINIDNTNVIKSNMGVDGVLFNPYAMEISNFEVVYPKEEVLDCPLYIKNVDITNIEMTDINGQEIQPYAEKAKVSFDVTYGANAISSIKYTFLSNESANYLVYNESNSLSRSHTFDVDNVLVNKPQKRGDLVVAEIDILDIYGNTYPFYKKQYLNGYNIKPVIRDLKFSQRTDGSKLVDISYIYDGISEINESYVYAQFSVDNGVTWSNVSSTTLIGDVLGNVETGLRNITWNPIVDLKENELGLPIMCRLTLYDADGTMALGETVSGYLNYDYEGPEVAILRK